MWVQPRRMDQLGTPVACSRPSARSPALLGTYLALVGIVLMSRSPWLDQLFGSRRLVNWHRWVGFATLWLLVGHTVFTTLGYAAQARSSIVDESSALLTTYPWVLMATVALVLLDRWSAVRLGQGGAPAAVLRDLVRHPPVRLPGDRAGLPARAGRGHRFRRRPVAQAYWVALYVLVIVLIVVVFGSGSRSSSRCATASASPRFAGGDDVVSVYITGRDLEPSPSGAGQFFQWRFLSSGGWWRAHPYSISSAPNGRYLRITVKSNGDDSWLHPAPEAGHPRDRRRPVRFVHRCAPSPRTGAAHRGRDRDHAAARDTRGDSWGRPAR